ncbi:hypothetical protein [Aquimarina sp. RZ0]|uniref:hypothetical protein n=1 Tax=Aquimarina sp. RZ0 TaxID=2607730 RepID=UPI0011F11A4F|nr:hypothetical protein [Aquimarina sp. RZ0]KAA1244505.1 hypothetical protein F0000_16085 [Aquimarina sp. RZ0]
MDDIYKIIGTFLVLFGIVYFLWRLRNECRKINENAAQQIKKLQAWHNQQKEILENEKMESKEMIAYIKNKINDRESPNNNSS